MKKRIGIIYFCAVLIALLAACAAPELQDQGPVPETPRQVEGAADHITKPTPAPIPTEIPYLIKPVDFSNDRVFCVSEPAASPFSLACGSGALVVSQAERARKTDIYLLREQLLSAERFSLTAHVLSEPADMDTFDQNQFGFYFKDTEGKTYALRIQGQYFSFEEWEITDGVEVVDAYNSTYTPTIYFAGRTNEFTLTCGWESCDLYANGALIARSPFGTGNGINAIGYFTASYWDEQFGSVTLERFEAEEISGNLPELQTFTLADDLTNDLGTFSKMGLSGAFSDFEDDGFHFSPVIPYGYYSAKADPALADASVSVVVNMDMVPGEKATQYAGLICRSSFDGKYIAILRVNGTYTIYRDAVRRPFALLTKGEVEGIQAGRADTDLRLDCVGDNISLYINDMLMESLTDTKFGLRYGRTGLFTKAGGGAHSDAVIFSDFSIEESS